MTKSLSKHLLTFSIFLLTANCLLLTAYAQTKLVPHEINLKSGKTFSLNLPADYEIIPAAENLNLVRFFAKSPDGRIFVTDMFNPLDVFKMSPDSFLLSDDHAGVVYYIRKKR